MRLIFLLGYGIITCEEKVLTFFDKYEFEEVIYGLYN